MRPNNGCLSESPDAPAIGDGYKPVNTVVGELGIQSNNGTFTTITLNAAGRASAMTGTYIICSEGILGKSVKQFETALDGGNTDTGLMRVNAPTVASKSVATAAILDSNLYIVCKVI